MPTIVTTREEIKKAAWHLERAEELEQWINSCNAKTVILRANCSSATVILPINTAAIGSESEKEQFLIADDINHIVETVARHHRKAAGLSE